MWPFPIQWDKISIKEGDDINLSLSPVQRALLLAVLINVQYIGEQAPTSMSIGEDSDNFDAVLSDILSKLAASE